MTAEELEALEKKLECPNCPDSSDSIGLYNIQQRIQLIYGPPYYMRITSHPREGTCVHLCLPLLPVD